MNPRLLFGLVELSALSIHEAVVPERLERLIREILADGELRHPILVDRRSLVVLDGHHRLTALTNLGYSLVPAYLVDYEDPAISVTTRRPEIPITKASVVEMGLSESVYPPRTSRHMLPAPPPPRPVKLDLLRRLADGQVASGPSGQPPGRAPQAATEGEGEPRFRVAR